jgi:hypothetical protein
MLTRWVTASFSQRTGFCGVSVFTSVQMFCRSVNHTLDINMLLLSICTAIYVGDLCFSCKRTVLLYLQDCFLEILPVSFVLWIDQQKYWRRSVSKCSMLQKSILYYTEPCKRPAFTYVNTYRKTPLEIKFVYLRKKEVHCIFKTRLHNLFIFQKCCFFCNFFFLHSNNTFFINDAPKI